MTIDQTHDAEQREEEMAPLLAEAYRDYEKSLLAYAYFKVSNRTLSDDLVQETYMRTWRYLMRGAEIVNMRAFLYHTLTCLITDEYRRKKTSSLDDLMEKGFEPATHSASTKMINKIDGKAALRLIPYLPEKYRSILTLRYIKGLSYAEICAKTGLTRNTAGVQVHRGVAKLKKLYLHEG